MSQQLNFSSPSPTKKFLDLHVSKNIIERIKKDKRLIPLQEYLNYNPDLIKNQARKYIMDNDELVLNSVDFNKIIDNILEFYDLHNQNIRYMKQIIPDPDKDDSIDNYNEEGGLTRIPRKKLGGKTKRKRVYKNKKNRTNKKLLRKKYKKINN